MPRSETRLFPALLKHWRTRRGLSQLDLALASAVSSRHVSFLETGRAQPSREMVLRLATTLSVPLREQNELLRAAGFPDEFAEPSFQEGLSPEITRAIERMLAQHEPFPMTVVDRHYDVLRVNAGATRLLSRFVLDPSALGPRMNMFSLLFDERLARSFIVDWEQVARAMVSRLHREALARPGDAALAGLLREIFEYEGVPESFRQPDFSAPTVPMLSLHLQRDDFELRFLTTITIFSAPQNITLEEIFIESYFPLDDATTRTCEALARTAP